MKRPTEVGQAVLLLQGGYRYFDAGHPQLIEADGSEEGFPCGRAALTERIVTARLVGVQDHRSDGAWTTVALEWDDAEAVLRQNDHRVHVGTGATGAGSGTGIGGGGSADTGGANGGQLRATDLNSGYEASPSSRAGSRVGTT